VAENGLAIMHESVSDSFGQVLLGSLSFVYGKTYTIESHLTGDASAYVRNGGIDSGDSTWSDTFTFHGEPDGTTGLASFNVNLAGNLSGDLFFDPARSANASGGVSSALRLDYNDIGCMETGSGVQSTPDGGSTLAFLTMGLSAIAMASRSRKSNSNSLAHSRSDWRQENQPSIQRLRLGTL
jgi:hypothetical protein